MDVQRQNFLAAVLGAEGASMLVKTVEKHPVLEHALLPRTILAWLQSAPRYEGGLPGNEATPVSFERSDTGFSGEVGMGDEIYKFEAVNVFHVAASVAVALGVDEMVSEGLRDLDIERLGKSIDALAKVKRVNDELDLEKSAPVDAEKAEPEPVDAECATCAEGKNHGNHGGNGAAAWYKPVHAYAPPKEKMGKDEDLDKAAGVPSAPTPPKPPTPPAAAAAKPTKPSIGPKPPKTATMTLQRSEAEHKCPACGGVQFKDNQFVGCICFRSFNKAIRVASSNAEAVTIEMDMRILDADDVATFREALGR
jgi:hypothetical protein